MANLGGTFDATQVEPNGTYEVIPPGDYVAQITSSEMQDNSKKDGAFLKLELEILDGDQAGRKLFDRLNLVNQNAQAVEIAQRTLSAICHAVGVLTVSDSEELHLRPMSVKVKVDPERTVNGKTYGPSNSIGGYKPVSDNVQPMQAQAQRSGFTQQTQQQAAKPAGLPWKRAG